MARGDRRHYSTFWGFRYPGGQPLAGRPFLGQKCFDQVSGFSSCYTGYLIVDDFGDKVDSRNMRATYDKDPKQT